MAETVLNLYARYRRDLYDPVFCMMIRGIRVDLDAMTRETARLLQERDAIKKKLDEATSLATGGAVVHLYKIASIPNPEFLRLREEKKQCKAKIASMRKTKKREKIQERAGSLFAPDKSESERRQVKNLYKSIDAQLKAMRAAGAHKIHSFSAGLSNDKIKAFLYHRMKCPKHVRDKKLTVDEAALLKIKEQRPALASIIDLILDHRHVEKVMQYVNPDRVDADGRLRFSFNVSGTVTDRFSSSANPRGTGMNIQNIAGELHHIFLPDPGYFFLSCDASQIEDRLVKIRTQHPAMAELARKRPWEFDAHTHTAAMMFNRPENKVTKDERQRGKILTHARERCMEAETLTNYLAEEGYKFTVSECQAMIDAWDRVHAPILEWQHRIRMQIIQQPEHRRRLYSSWGRYIDFNYERLGDSLYRDAISWLPQHECVMLINQYGLIPVWRLVERDGKCDDPTIIEAIAKLAKNETAYAAPEKIDASPSNASPSEIEKIDASPEYYVNKRSYRSFLSAQIHDELLMQCPWDDLDEAYNIMVFLRASLERERIYAGLALSIPMEFSVGAKCWAKDLGWKRMPSRKEFKDAMIQLKRKVGI
jgi:hypothetical protein